MEGRAERDGNFVEVTRALNFLDFFRQSSEAPPLTDSRVFFGGLFFFFLRRSRKQEPCVYFSVRTPSEGLEALRFSMCKGVKCFVFGKNHPLR